MNESARIAAVRVEFVCEDDRSRDWRVRFVRVEEALSSVLRAEVALEVDDDDDNDPEALLGIQGRSIALKRNSNSASSGARSRSS